MVNTNGPVKAACFGNRKRGTTDKVTLSDRFPIGSNTKSMTATLAAVMVETGQIDWDTTLGDVWPKATDDNLHPILRTVTLDQLLSHQSGLPGNISDLSGQAWAGFFDEKQSPPLERRRMLNLVLSQEPSQPQGQFAYSNLGYAIASAMLETRAGVSFESLMKQHVFVPLEMGSADFRSMKSAKQRQPPLLWGHQAANGDPVDPRTAGSENPTVYAAAGTVHLSTEDYAKYARWHLAGKPSPVLRTQNAFDHLHKPQVDYSLPGAKYGCGWIIMDTGLGPALNHTGSNTNAYALIWVLPESDFAAVVCANSGQSQAYSACDAMMSHLMMELATTQTKPKVVTPERLVGRYQLAPNFIFDVNLRDGHLMVGITNQPTQEVFADSPTKWSYRGVDAQLEFHLRAEGPAYALTLHQNGAAQQAKRVRE
ncbi:serine hydrolase [Novipirellula artificiosorum]|uniref:serine hydrolase n=1 Tax=Novipirellula artificiosorum TaxID=2528016 RepID=UPI001E5458F9|nr:serine hydrolase [Novipirellula artificiosorum]